MCKDLVDEWVLVTEDEISFAVYNMLQEHCKVSQYTTLINKPRFGNLSKSLPVVRMKILSPDSDLAPKL